jgi:hypothetical protein
MTTRHGWEVLGALHVNGNMLHFFTVCNMGIEIFLYFIKLATSSWGHGYNVQSLSCVAVSILDIWRRNVQSLRWPA